MEDRCVTDYTTSAYKARYKSSQVIVLAVRAFQIPCSAFPRGCNRPRLHCGAHAHPDVGIWIKKPGGGRGNRTRFNNQSPHTRRYNSYTQLSRRSRRKLLRLTASARPHFHNGIPSRCSTFRWLVVFAPRPRNALRVAGFGRKSSGLLRPQSSLRSDAVRRHVVLYTATIALNDSSFSRHPI